MRKLREIARQLEEDNNNEYLTLEYAEGGRKYIHVGYMPELQDNNNVQEFIDYVCGIYTTEIHKWDKVCGLLEFKIV